jgi:hypothetical protein
MSAAESYSRATRSSNLKLDDLEIGDLDWLIAAGMVRESLATRLIRLRAEFDAISRGPYSRTLRPALRGFPLARQYFVEYAVSEAPARIDAATAEEIAVRVLDLFLDPNCPACGGRGFNGGYGAPTLRCSVCRETGKRQHLWKNDVQEQYAGWLMSSIEAKIDSALGDMRRKLRDR